MLQNPKFKTLSNLLITCLCNWSKGIVDPALCRLTSSFPSPHLIRANRNSHTLTPRDRETERQRQRQRHRQRQRRRRRDGGGGLRVPRNAPSPRLLLAARRALEEFPTYRLVVTGHSAGGALASLLIAELASWTTAEGAPSGATVLLVVVVGVVVHYFYYQ